MIAPPKLPLKDQIEYYKKMGFNCIPLHHQSKKPTIKWESYQLEKYAGPFNDDNGVAIILGETSERLIVIDLDDPTILSDLFDVPKLLESTIVGKTTDGNHILLRVKGKLPTPSIIKLKDVKGRRIDILSQGRYICAPPSLHEKSGVPYEWLSNSKVTVVDEFQPTLDKLYSKGFTKTGKAVATVGDATVGILGKDADGLYSALEMEMPDFILKEGERHDNAMRFLNWLVFGKKKNTWPEFEGAANRWNKTVCMPPINDIDVRNEWRDMKRDAFRNAHVELAEKKANAAITDEGNLKRTEDDLIGKAAQIIRKNNIFVTLRKSDEILSYNGKIYSSNDAESIIREESEKIIEKCKSNDRNEVINKIKAQTYRDIKEFDADPYLITTESGILNLETLELVSHTSEHLSRILISHEFVKPEFEIHDETIFEDIEKNLKDTLFWSSLVRCFTVDGKFRKTDFECQLEVMAAPFVKRHIDEKNVMALGGGNNGKSVMLRYLEFLLGKENVSHVPLQDIEEERFMRAELDGKLANIFTDLEPDEMRHTGRIKAMTSNEGIQVQRKHQHPYTLFPFAKLMFSCNRFPKVYDQSQAFFRRWIIIIWGRDFAGDSERKEKLFDELCAKTDEANLVFSCLLFLSRRLLLNGKFTHTKPWQQIQREWNENADPIDQFVSNYIKDSEGNKTKRETYHFYKKIMLSKGERPLGIGQFGKVMAEYFDDLIERDCAKTRRYWCNIDFVEPKQTSLKEHSGS